MRLGSLLVAAGLMCMVRQAASINNGDQNLEDLVVKLSEQVAEIREELSGIKGHMAQELTSLNSNMNRKLTQQDELIRELETKTTSEQTTGGPTFVRWGKKTCNGTNSELVYTGVAGGTGGDQVGGGANLLCLSRNPIYGNHDDINHFNSRILGAEYQTGAASNFPFETTDPLLIDNDIPCAVCQVTNSSSLVMIPGTWSCTPDWRMEYRGYLMAPHEDNEQKNQFICVDEFAEVGFNGQTNNYAVRFVPAESLCDSALPCPPYVDHWEMTCVVCSK